MPADEQFDAVHPLTVAGEVYGCWNRAPFKLTVESGQHRYPFAMSRDCLHDQKQIDSRCDKCRWIHFSDAELRG